MTLRTKKLITASMFITAISAFMSSHDEMSALVAAALLIISMAMFVLWVEEA